MKKIIFGLIIQISLVTSVTIAQEIEWQKCYGGSGSEWPYCVQLTSDGGFIIAGSAGSINGNVTGNHGSADYWLVKTDSAGTLQWQKCYGGSNLDQAWFVQQTTDGGYILTGNSKSIDGDVTGNHGNNDYWLVKVDSTGNLQWQKSFGGTDDDWGYTVKQTFDGGYLVTGYTFSNDGDVTSNHGYVDCWVVKTDGSGNLQWQKCFGGSFLELFYSIITTMDGGYLLSGTTESNDGDVSGNHGDNDCWLVKTDSAGNIQWQHCYGGSLGEGVVSALATSDGGYVFGGSTESNNFDVSGNHGSIDNWLVKVDSTGILQWQKCYGSQGGEVAYSIAATSDDGFIMAGSTESLDSTITCNGGLDYFIVKVDSTGNLQRQKNFGGSDWDESFSIQQVSNGKYVAVGYAKSNDFDVTGNHAAGSMDYWLIKFDDEYNTITGKLFLDTNSNSVQDAGEISLKNYKITEAGTNRFGFSGQTGNYNVYLFDTGSYSVSPQGINYYTSVPASHNANFSSLQQTDSLNDFAFQPAGVFNDLCIHLSPLSDFNAGFNAHYMLTYENAGTTTLMPTVIFFPDDDLSYISASPAASTVTTDSVVWNLGPLAPYQNASILVTVNVNSVTPIGTLINSIAEIDPVAGDANPLCNYSSWEIYTTGPVDPNAILVDRDTVFTNELGNPPYLNYIIYFQNTGTDTAVNVRVIDNIPQRLDINSFEFVASSHAVSITYGAYARLMTFAFDNILLPDSNVNEAESHGFIAYRIKPNSNLVDGNKIFNDALIYFDYSSPVQTNYAMTEIVMPTGLSPDPVLTDKDITIFPNPAKEYLEMRMDNFMPGRKNEIKIFDLFGRTVLKSVIKYQEPIRINISNFSQGVYFVEINNGSNSMRGKFVKE